MWKAIDAVKIFDKDCLNGTEPIWKNLKTAIKNWIARKVIGMLDPYPTSYKLYYKLLVGLHHDAY